MDAVEQANAILVMHNSHVSFNTICAMWAGDKRLHAIHKHMRREEYHVCLWEDRETDWKWDVYEGGGTIHDSLEAAMAEYMRRMAQWTQ